MKIEYSVRVPVGTMPKARYLIEREAERLLSGCKIVKISVCDEVELHSLPNLPHVSGEHLSVSAIAWFELPKEEDEG